MTASPVYFKGLVTVLILAGLFVLIAIPLVLRKVPPNCVYGFRTPKTLKNDKIWYEANAYFGRAIIFASPLSALAILILYFIVQPTPDLFFKASLFALVVPSGIAVILTLIRIRNMNGHWR